MTDYHKEHSFRQGKLCSLNIKYTNLITKQTRNYMKHLFLSLFATCLAFACMHPAAAQDWTYDFEDFTQAINAQGPKRVIDATLNGVGWHMYGVRDNYDGTDFCNGKGSMRLYGEMMSSSSDADEPINFTLSEPRSIGTFEFKMRANSNWYNTNTSWITQYTTDGDNWITIGDEFAAGKDVETVSRTINMHNCRVRIVRSDYLTYDASEALAFRDIVNIDDIRLSGYDGSESTQLSADVSSLDFGEVIKDEQKTLSFTLTHIDLPAEATMSIEGQAASSFTFTPQQLGDAESDVISVTCQPLQKGMLKAVFTVRSGSISLQIPLSAYGRMPEGIRFSGGTGTAEDPFIISDATDLEELSDNVENNKESFAGQYFLMTSDIDMSNVANLRPIGNNFGRSADLPDFIRPFSGTFDGAGHTIRNLQMEHRNELFGGLFGIIDNATIKNVNIDNSDIYISVGAAAIVGAGTGKCSIVNCHVGENVSITNGSYYAGGIIGGLLQGDGSTIADCTNAATVKSINISGGIIANNSQTGLTIERCGNLGNIVEANSYTGGICGYTTEGLTINDCYNTGKIELYNNQQNPSIFGGGILGAAMEVSAYDNITITNCYNAGHLDYDYGTMHPIFVFQNTEGNNYTIVNCYNATDIAPGGYAMVDQLTTAQMRLPVFADMLNEYERSVWQFEEGVNNGLPVPTGGAADKIVPATGQQKTMAKIVNGRVVVEGSYDSITVYDISGQQVDANALPDGLYIVKITSNGKTTTQKIMK